MTSPVEPDNGEDERQYEVVVQQIEHLVAVEYERSSAYTNLVMAVGYAGVFGIWSFVKDDLDPRSSLLVALLFLISLAAFIFNEVFQGYNREKANRKVAKLTQQGSTIDELINSYKRIADERAVKAALVWPWAWSVATGAGLLSVAVLLFEIGSQLVNALR